MNGTLLDIYGNYQDALDRFNREAERWNEAYIGKTFPSWDAYNAAMASKPEAPIEPRGQTDTQALGEVLPQDLYQSIFGKGTPDTLTNEAWSLQNISTPFMSSAPETAYDLGQVNRMNNPLYAASPDLLTTGQQAFDPSQTMYSQSQYY
jgi:hypothetical protein